MQYAATCSYCLAASLGWLALGLCSVLVLVLITTVGWGLVPVWLLLGLVLVAAAAVHCVWRVADCLAAVGYVMLHAGSAWG